MKLMKNVGKNCSPRAHDVLMAQRALSTVKNKKHKPYYCGKMDGKQGPKTLKAISDFQCDNGIKPTGKLEAYGSTINRLRLKLPLGVKTQLKQCEDGAGQPHVDMQKVRATASLTKNEILKKSPLPKKEAEALGKIVMDVAGAGIPLTLRHVLVETSGGRFSVKFDIAPFALPTGPAAAQIKRDMVPTVSQFVGKYGAWHAGDKNALTYRSAQAYDILKGQQSPSAVLMRYLGLSNIGSSDVVVNSMLAGFEAVIKNELLKSGSFMKSARVALPIFEKTALPVTKAIRGLNLKRGSLLTWDSHTNRRIATLHPRVQPLAFLFINRVEQEMLIRLRVTQATRTIEEQDALYAQGRTAPGPQVTPARGGKSYHNYGLAIDVVEIMADRSANYHNSDTAFWERIASIAKEIGFEWGGNFSASKIDLLHFEMSFGLSIDQLLNGERP